VTKLLPRFSLGVIGLVVLTVGVIKVVGVTGTASAIALLSAGVLLLISPFVIDRIERFSVTTQGVEFRLTQEISDLGAEKTAMILERTDLARFADSYTLIHDELSDEKHKATKVYLLDLLVDRSASIARRQKFDATEVRNLFRDGTPMMRILTLGLMEGDLSLADGPTILSAIIDFRTKNEQYHGLQLAQLCWRMLAGSERRAIHHAVADDTDIPPDSDRRLLADKVLSLPLTEPR
jgi:hypothetical protein